MIYVGNQFKVPASKMLRVIINTDAKNEADDQYAIVHGLLSPRFDCRGLIAAHFGNEKTEHSMQDSYDEILHILKLMGIPPEEFVYHGATHGMEEKWTPVVSEGAQLIIDEAMRNDAAPLYVLLLGPLTDLACAYRMEPRIADRLTAVWIGGGAYPGGGWEYNLSNDVLAAQIVMESPIPLWQIPKNVYEMVRVSHAELEYRVAPHGALGQYLFEQLIENGFTKYGLRPVIRTGEAWLLGDSPAIGLLLCEQRFDYEWVQAPLIGADMSYVPSMVYRPIRVYHSVDARFIMEDFYAKLAMFTAKQGQGLPLFTYT